MIGSKVGLPRTESFEQFGLHETWSSLMFQHHLTNFAEQQTNEGLLFLCFDHLSRIPTPFYCSYNILKKQNFFSLIYFKIRRMFVKPLLVSLHFFFLQRIYEEAKQACL